jgi:hypothetical protein
MTVPVVAELSAWTSVYGRLAPPPPVAAASAGWTAIAATPAAARDTAATLMASVRLRSRTAGNTIAPLGGTPGLIARRLDSGKKGTGRRNFADLDGKHIDISLQDLYEN